MHSIISFISSVSDATAVADLMSSFESMIESCGLQYYKVIRSVRREGDDEHGVIASRFPPGWELLYRERKYARVDPVRKKLALARRPFRCSDAVRDARSGPHQKRMQAMLDAAQQHGLREGHAFPVHGRKGVHGGVVLCGATADLGHLQITLMDTAVRILFWRLMELQDAERDVAPERLPDIAMTQRELDVLFLLADGMTSHDMARELAISSHTVDWYINGIQEKMNARNRQHVVATAFRHGLIF